MSSVRLFLALFFVFYVLLVQVQCENTCTSPHEGHGVCSDKCAESCVEEPSCTDTCVSGCVCQSGYKRIEGTCVPQNMCDSGTSTTDSSTTPISISSTPSSSTTTSSSTTLSNEFLDENREWREGNDCLENCHKPKDDCPKGKKWGWYCKRGMKWMPKIQECVRPQDCP